MTEVLAYRIWNQKERILNHRQQRYESFSIVGSHRCDPRRILVGDSSGCHAQLSGKTVTRVAREPSSASSIVFFVFSFSSRRSALSFVTFCTIAEGKEASLVGIVFSNLFSEAFTALGRKRTSDTLRYTAVRILYITDLFHRSSSTTSALPSMLDVSLFVRE